MVGRTMPAVGARGVVHMPQFNGKQEGPFTPIGPNLRCPRNGKQTRDPKPFWFAPLPSRSHWIAGLVKGLCPGKAMEVDLSARIPANKVEVRPAAGTLP